MLIDPDLQFDARTIRAWMHHKTVSLPRLIEELRDWADYFEDEQAKQGQEPEGGGV